MIDLQRFLIKLIRYYQQFPTKAHYACRHIPSCSNYAISVIEDYGAIKGTFLSLKRILKCNCFCRSGIDLPPIKEK